VDALREWGRLCLAWPLATAGALLTAAGGACLRLAVRVLDCDDLLTEDD
jgi:hypothetical protein